MGCTKCIFLYVRFWCSQQSKHVVSNKTDISVFVMDGLCFFSAVHISQRDVVDKYITGVFVERTANGYRRAVNKALPVQRRSTEQAGG